MVGRTVGRGPKMKPDRSLLLRLFRTILVATALALFGILVDPRAAAAIQVLSEVIADEPCLVAIKVTASDPVGPITSLTADLSNLPEGHDATFVTDASNTSGTLLWHPAPGDRDGAVIFFATANGQTARTYQGIVVPQEVVQAAGYFTWLPTLADLGTYTIVFEARSSDDETVSFPWPLTVISRPAVAPSPSRYLLRAAEAPTRGPIVSIVGCSQCGGEIGEIDTVNVSSYPNPEFFNIGIRVTDPDAESIVSLTADLSGLPAGNTATFTARFQAAARAGGPYSGIVGEPVEFDGSASSGTRFAWDFGDSHLGEGSTPSHTYALPGTYPVTLAASGLGVDNGTLGDCDVTSVVIRGDIPARAFLVDGHRSTPDSPGVQPFCVQLEPVNGGYDNADVDLSTIRMISDWPGSTASIAAVSDKTTVTADRDRNGIQEISACFRRADLRSFLDGTQGRQTVPVSIVGTVRTGGTLQADLELRLVGTGSSLAGSIRPNPLHRTGVVVFQTSKPGPIKVLLFDANGRLVRTLLDRPQVAGGRHEVAIDGRDARGRRLASGIYWYRVQAAEGMATGRLMILE